VPDTSLGRSWETYRLDQKRGLTGMRALAATAFFSCCAKMSSSGPLMDCGAHLGWREGKHQRQLALGLNGGQLLLVAPAGHTASSLVRATGPCPVPAARRTLTSGSAPGMIFSITLEGSLSRCS